MAAALRPATARLRAPRRALDSTARRRGRRRSHHSRAANVPPTSAAANHPGTRLSLMMIALAAPLLLQQTSGRQRGDLTKAHSLPTLEENPEPSRPHPPP